MKKKLELEESQAKKIYKSADSELKTILESTFGKEFFSDKITDRIKTWEDVLEVLDLDEGDILPYLKPKTKEQKAINAFAKIQKISEVLNEGWIPDYNNTNQYKFYPYFEKKSLGWSVGSFPVGGVCCSGMGFGSLYKSSELALYAGNQFLDIYKDYLPN